MKGTIIATGAYAPDRVVCNDEISRFVDTDDEWITKRTGIKRRHIAEKETVSSMAAKAAKDALKNAQISADKIDLIIVSTMTPDCIMPCTACIVQKEIGAENAFCFDLNAACTGFAAAIITAQAYMEIKFAKYALVIGSEVLSGAVDWSDRSSCILFGDGAGAVLMRVSNDLATLPVLSTESEKSKDLTLYFRHGKSPLEENEKNDWQDKKYYIGMKGRTIFEFALRKIPYALEELLKKNNLKKEDIKFYILHQANLRIIEAAAKRLNEPMEKFPFNVDEYGNTSSASIPILLNELDKKGMLKDNDKIAIVGFGAGLSFGADLITWNKN